MLERPATLALNHLLAASPWAEERLRGFAGRALRIEGGPLVLVLRVNGLGHFEGVAETHDSEPDVVIELPPDTPTRILNDRKSLFSAARISGTADFAETLGFVFKNLRWDAEADLSRIVGDIAAHRLMQGASALFAWQGEVFQRVQANVAEFIGDDAKLVVSVAEFDRFRQSLNDLQRDLERLDARLNRPN